MMSLVDNLNVIFAFLFGVLSGIFVGIVRTDRVLEKWKNSDLEWYKALQERSKAHISDVRAACKAIQYVIDTGKLSKEEILRMNEIFQGRADYDLPTQTG